MIKLAANLADLDPTRTTDISVLASSILYRIPYFLGGFALLAILYSGFMYVTAYGDATKMEQAKKNITWVIVGIIVVALLSIIINLILKIIFAVTD
jgi:hypothetical protein